MEELVLGIGTRLQHTQFGPGVIVGVRYATYLIAFIDSGIKEIEKTPYRYPTRHKSYKEVAIQVFPFILIYRIAKRQKTVRIISVFHTSKSSKKKYK